jgi:hypothetical protein
VSKKGTVDGWMRVFRMHIKVLQVSESAQKAEKQAEFGKPIDESMKLGLLRSGLQGAAHRASNCMGWVWRQWLMGNGKEVLAPKVEPFVSRGLEMRAITRSYHGLPVHDLYLLNCAIFGGSDAQVMAVAEKVTDASGDKGEGPRDDGELYAAAWCGMMKYWILADERKAAEQSELIWGAYRQSGMKAASKPLVIPWLKRDWKAFAKAQSKDFEKLWNRARKDCWTVRSENSTEVVVTTERYQIEHQWCWAHCGMALLAHREGAEVVTDPFWFPEVAIGKNGDDTQRKNGSGSEQLSMF